MTRDAKLYFLKLRDWKPLADIFLTQSDHLLKDDITIFKLSSIIHHYAILTLSDKVDKIVEEYGAILASEEDLLRNALLSENNYGEPLFGDKNNIGFLKKASKAS